MCKVKLTKEENGCRDYRCVGEKSGAHNIRGVRKCEGGFVIVNGVGVHKGVVRILCGRV